jgi:hypothetical protein
MFSFLSEIDSNTDPSPTKRRNGGVSKDEHKFGIVKLENCDSKNGKLLRKFLNLKERLWRIVEGKRRIVFGAFEGSREMVIIIEGCRNVLSFDCSFFYYWFFLLGILDWRFFIMQCVLGNIGLEVYLIILWF